MAERSCDVDVDLQAVYERARPKLRVMASRYVGWNDADDVVQEAFVRALAYPGVFRRDASVATWMTRIVLNTAIDETRRRKRRPACVDGGEPCAAEHGVAPVYVERLALKSALSATTRIDREVLALAVLGFSCEEAAQRLGVTVPAVKSRLCNARRRLRQRMADDRRVSSPTDVPRRRSPARPPVHVSSPIDGQAVPAAL